MANQVGFRIWWADSANNYAFISPAHDLPTWWYFVYPVTAGRLDVAWYLDCPWIFLMLVNALGIVLASIGKATKGTKAFPVETKPLQSMHEDSP